MHVFASADVAGHEKTIPKLSREGWKDRMLTSFSFTIADYNVFCFCCHVTVSSCAPKVRYTEYQLPYSREKSPDSPSAVLFQIQRGFHRQLHWVFNGFQVGKAFLWRDNNVSLRSECAVVLNQLRDGIIVAIPKSNSHWLYWIDLSSQAKSCHMREVKHSRCCRF